MELDNTIPSTSFSGYSHSFDVGVATHLNNVEAAIIFNHIRFWIHHNKINEINQIDGRTWTYTTASKISKEFPYLNERQVKYALQILVAKGYLIKANYNKNSFDKTPWYALCDESLASFEKNFTMRQNCPIDKTKLSHPQDKIVPSYKDKDKNSNIRKEDKKEGAPVSSNTNTKYGEHVELKEGEYDKLCKSIGKELTEHYIEAINNWVPNNKPFKDYAATIRSWYNRDKANGTIPKTQNLRSSINPSKGSLEKNKSICELVEKKLGHLFNERVFFQAGPSSAMLINTNKDIKKEFSYEKFESNDLKEVLLHEMETCFPGAKSILLGTKKHHESESLGEMINHLSEKFKMQE